MTKTIKTYEEELDALYKYWNDEQDTKEQIIYKNT